MINLSTWLVIHECIVFMCTYFNVKVGDSLYKNERLSFICHVLSTNYAQGNKECTLSL